MSRTVKSNRILIAATGSGRGKTTIASALLCLLKEKKYDVHAFKCGPDYIDPMYHEAVLGLPSKNLDPFFCDKDLLKASYIEDAGDINIVEGCMGLFDGMGVTPEFSSYDVAKTLDMPIVLVVDASKMGYSVVAHILGFLALDNASLIKGVFLNRISGSFYAKIKPVIEVETGLSVLGYLPYDKTIALESRHLGLKSVGENEAIEKINHVVEILKDTFECDKLIEIAKDAPNVLVEKEFKEYVNVKSNHLVAVAKDEAFNFYYKDNLRAIELTGAKIIYFSPIHDKKLPEGTTAIYIGGGYPENYLKELSENISMKNAIKSAVENDMFVFAECGGFMYLQSAIDNYQMVGIFDDNAENTNKSVRFGYIEGHYNDMSVRGHEFHHYDVNNPGDMISLKKYSTGEEYRGVLRKKNCIAGFPHYYFVEQINSVLGGQYGNNL